MPTRIRSASTHELSHSKNLDLGGSLHGQTLVLTMALLLAACETDWEAATGLIL